MGTIATKLEYLNTTKEKIRDSINLTGANIGTSDTFRSYASKLKKGYIDIINNGIDTLYNNFPKVSGIGSNLSLTPTYEAPMKLNEIQGDTLQDSQPTPDTPVEIQSVTGNQEIKVTGKNLVDFSNLQTNSNTTYTWQNDILEVKATTGTYNRVYIDITSLYKNNPGKTLRFDYETLDFSQGVSSSVNLQIVRSGTNTYVELVDNLGTIITRTIPNDTSEITQVLLRVVCNNTNTSQASQISITKPILHFGNIATTYEPYKGNTYEVNLGKNIWSVGNKNVSWATNYVDVKNILNTLSEGTYSITLNFKVTEIVKEKTNNLYGFTFHNSNGHIYNKKNTNSNINVDDIFTFVYTFTISKTQVGNFTNAYFYGFGNDTDDVTAKSLMYDCQLEKGTQATSYSPYFTPIELNKIGDYQDSIKKSTGKNLFNKDNTSSINAYINDSTSKFTSSGTVKTYYIPCKGNATYTLSKILSNQFRVGTSVNIPAIDGDLLQVWKDNSATTYSITTNSSAKYLCFCIHNSSGATVTEQQVLDSLMINEGSTALPYEPYGKVWYLEKQIGKVVVDGTETGWALFFSTNGIFVNNNVVSSISNATGINCISNYFSNTYSRNYIRSHLDSVDNVCATNLAELILANKSISSVNDLKTWLSTHNTTVYYVLATPEYTEITNTELIEDLETLYTAKSQEGTTNISITSEDLEMILNVSALKGEV